MIRMKSEYEVKIAGNTISITDVEKAEYDCSFICGFECNATIHKNLNKYVTVISDC